MGETGKFRLASREWLEAVEAILADLLGAAGDEGRSWNVRICEVFENAPADLADPAGVRAWTLEIRNGRATARVGRSDAPIGTVADYEAVLPLARHADHDTAAARAMDACRGALRDAGKLRSFGDRSDMPPKLSATLRELHNRLAPMTA